MTLDFVDLVGRRYAQAAGRSGAGGGKLHVDAQIRDSERGEQIVESVVVEVVFPPGFEVWRVAEHRAAPSKLEAAMNLRNAVRRREVGEAPDRRMRPEAVAELVAGGVRVRASQ